MSPEQGMGQAVDRRSDIYSLGIVFFHCLTGHVPFTADSPLTITVKHINDPLPVEQLVAENVPGPVLQVVQQMTAKQPHERYQSADVMIDALTSALAASNLILPRPGRSVRGGMLSPLASGLQQGMPLGTSPNASSIQGHNPQQFSPNTSVPPSMQPVITLTCFRCGAPNPSTRLYCTTCGDDLSNKRAGADRYLGPNGRPVLARLSIQQGPMAGRSYRFHQDVTTIGRTTGNDLVISGRTVSRRHARLWFSEGRWYLEDLQSANGTLLNNLRIQQPVVLNDGDIINFGDEIVIFNVTYGP
jgi:serine/threonine protein kinase